MDYLYTAYRQEFDKKEALIFYDSLGIYDDDIVLKSMQKHVENSVFFPRVADLLKIIRDSDISFEQVMSDLHSIMAIRGTWSSKNYHPVTRQIIKELGGKFSLTLISEKELEKKVRMKYKYVVSEHILKITHDEQKQLKPRTGSQTLGELTKQIEHQSKGD